MNRTVVINLARRPDRLAQFADTWQTSGWETVLGTPEVFPAVDGPTGMHGCWASHIAVLRQALDDDMQRLAVFEDDAVPTVSAARLADILDHLPADASLWLDATYPGIGNELRSGSRGTVRLRMPPRRTHAYILRQPMIELLLPVITRFPAHIDHHYQWAPTGWIYATMPSLAAQSGSESDVQAPDLRRC